MCKELTPWEKVVEFHGHICPGIAIGYRVAVMALNTFGKSYPLGDEGLCLAGQQFCGLDALQLLVGVTYGKGNLRVEPELDNRFVVAYHRKGLAYSFAVNPKVFGLVTEWQRLFEQQRKPEVTKELKNELTLEIVNLTQQIMDLADEEFCSCEAIDYHRVIRN